MEKKKSIKISLSTLFLILAIIVIIVMGIFISKLYSEKTGTNGKSTELQKQVNILNETISELQTKISNISNTISENNQNNYNNEIIIEGTYSEGAVGYLYQFYKDGSVNEGDELVSSTGKYKTIGRNQVQVVLTKRITSDIDTMEENIETINESYTITVIDENTLKLEDEREGDKYEFEITKVQD